MRSRALGGLVASAILGTATIARADEPRSLSERVVRDGVDIAVALDSRWLTSRAFTPAFRLGYTFGGGPVGVAVGGELRLLDALALDRAVDEETIELRGYARVVVRDRVFAMYAGIAGGATQGPDRSSFEQRIETAAAGAVQLGAAVHVGPRVGFEVGAELEANGYYQDERIAARVGAFARF